MSTTPKNMATIKLKESFHLSISATKKKSFAINRINSQEMGKMRRLSMRDEDLLKIINLQIDQPLSQHSLERTAPLGSVNRINSAINSRNDDCLQLNEINLANFTNTTPNQNNISLSTSSARNIITDENVPPSDFIAHNEEMDKLSLTPPSWPKDHPIMLRIQKDLNSPSASTRLRAIKALRTQTQFSNYCNFDIPHEEQDIITAEERGPAAKPRTIQDVMKDVVAYVEVRTEEDNRSSGIKKVIQQLGAKVNDRLYRNTTHVIFKDGLASTYNKAKNWNIPIVSILWIETCKRKLRLVDPTLFVISNVDRYENPELYKKIRRQKSMQPNPDLNFKNYKMPQRKKKLGVPSDLDGESSLDCFASSPSVSSKTNTDSISPEPDLSIIRKSLFSDESNDIQSTIDSNTIIECDTEKEKTQTNATTVILDANSSTKVLEHRRVTRRMTINASKDFSNMSNNKSMMDETKKLSGDMSLDITLNKKTPLKSTLNKRQTMYTPNPMDFTDNIPTQDSRNRSTTFLNEMPSMNYDLTKTPKKKISPPKKLVNSVQKTGMGMDAILREVDNTPMKNNTSQPINRRRTLFTPNKLIEVSRSKELIEKSQLLVNNFSNDKISCSASTPITMNNSTPITNIGTQKANLHNNDEFHTPLQQNITAAATVGGTSNTIFDEYNKTLTFNSARTPISAKRKTIFDISMEIIDQRLQNINRNVRLNRSVSESDITIDEVEESIVSQLTRSTPQIPPNMVGKKIDDTNKLSSSDEATTDKVPETPPIPVVETVQVKKRKLFAPSTYYDLNSISEEINNEILSTMTNTTKTASKVDRRRTLLKSGDNDLLKVTQKKPLKPKTVPSGVPPKSLATNQPSNRRSTMDFQTVKKQRLTGTKNNEKEPQQSKLSLVYTNMHTPQINFIKETVQKLGGFTIEDNVTIRTTHLVSFEPKRTVNFLRGIIRGRWILNYNWIVDSAAAGKWLLEEPYEVQTFSTAVSSCRADRQAFGPHFCIKIFADVGPMYVSSKCKCTNLLELIKLCGGHVTNDISKAKYYISEHFTFRAKCVCLHPNWILDCIGSAKLLNKNSYILRNDQNIYFTQFI